MKVKQVGLVDWFDPKKRSEMGLSIYETRRFHGSLNNANFGIPSWLIGLSLHASRLR